MAAESLPQTELELGEVGGLGADLGEDGLPGGVVMVAAVA